MNHTTATDPTSRHYTLYNGTARLAVDTVQTVGGDVVDVLVVALGHVAEVRSTPSLLTLLSTLCVYIYIGLQTVGGDVVDVLVVALGHVAEVREDDEPSEQTRARVDAHSRQTVPTHTHTHTGTAQLSPATLLG